MSKSLKGFITYSHKDTEAKDELITRLAVMKQQNELITWHDNEMLPSDKWREEIFSTRLPDSDLLLYLVSAASLASENCNKELGIALKKNIKPIPIILEDCDWKKHQLGEFQALPDKGNPINEWHPESKGWQNVVDGIRKFVDAMQSQTDSSSGTSEKELRAELAFQQGSVFIMIGQMNKAIEAYSRAIELNPNNVNTHHNRGVAYRSAGNYGCAIRDFGKVIELNPNDADAYNSRGEVYSDKREYDCAISDFTKAIALSPNDANTYYNRGTIYGNTGNYDCAIADFDKAIELNPNDADAYNNRGVAYRNTGNYNRAIDDFNKAIKFKSDFVGAYYNRGIAYYKKGDYDRAVDDFNKAVGLEPDFIEAYYNRGVTYEAKGEADCAIADYTKAIELNPDLTEAYNNRGGAYGNTGNYDRAVDDFNKVIELNPNDANAYNNRGMAYYKKGDYDRTIDDFNKVIELNPNDANAYNNRGVTYYKKGDYDRTIDDFNKAIELNPNDANAYYNRGEVGLHLEEWDEARVDLTVARDLGMDIIASFHNDYESVEAYERSNRVKLPEDIATMLTQRRRSRFPRTEKFLSPDGTPFESPDVLNLLAKLRDAGPPLSQYVPMRSTFGLRTGGSGAFVVDSVTRDQLIAEHPSSTDILKPFLHGRDIRRWGVAKPDSWLIFTYRRIEINRYPAIRKHLEKYRSALRKRAGKQKWYELPVARRDAEHFVQTKLICPNSYDHQTFAVDTEGFYCGDTCYLIPTEETWLCGLLNSRAVEWFYSQASNQLTGDYLRARSRYMQQIPIPNLTSAQKSQIGKIVDYLIFLQGQPTTNSGDLAHARDFIMLGYFERIIDGLVYESYLGEELHQGEKQFFKPLFDERLPHLEEIRGDKMAALREIFERLYERTHPVRRNLFFLDSVKPIRIIEGKA